ncbi:hypothetical protein NVP1291O_58 [Vibrio phage 1.291.O._10N.286.55.F6]|nr:hypothetical protein NVP1291O_58 [Vibrio phage 1.291.O._10N.286.55.F6]
MNTLESKLRIAHQIQVAAIKKGLSISISATPDHFLIGVNVDGKLIDMVWNSDATEQELLDWWEAIEK